MVSATWRERQQLHRLVVAMDVGGNYWGDLGDSSIERKLLREVITTTVEPRCVGLAHEPHRVGRTGEGFSRLRSDNWRTAGDLLLVVHPVDPAVRHGEVGIQCREC